MTGASAEKSAAELRRSARQRTFLGAKLVYGEEAYTVDCVVRDVSETGARVKLPAGQAVPDHLYLLEVRSGVAYESRVAWKRHPEIGLQFLRQYELADASTPHLKILKRLWLETQQRSGI
jgi:hypothetical protein